MTDFPYEEAAAIPFRVRENSRRIESLERWRREVDTVRATQTEQIAAMSEAVVSLSARVDGLAKILIGFAFSIAASSVIFALSILVATGKLP